MQKCAEGTPTNLAAPCHNFTEMVFSQLPRGGPNCLLSQEVLNRGDYPHNFQKLKSLVDSGA